MTRKTAIGNRKGGVGKTSVTLGLAVAYAAMNKKVLIVDLDSQANATTALEAEGEFDIFDVLYAGESGTLGQAIVPTSWEGIDAIPGSKALARIESESLMTPELRLKTAAWKSTALEQYDHILIDLPPALGRLTLNGLIWADRVIVVTEPAAFSVEGVGEFLETVEQVRSLPHLNPELEFAGIVINKTSSPLTSEHEFQITELAEAYGEKVLGSHLPARTAMQDSVSSRVPLNKLGSRGGNVLYQRFLDLAVRLNGEK